MELKDKKINKPFKIRFPVIMTPDSFGRCPAIVVATAPNSADPNSVFAMCVDIEGRYMQHVPVRVNDLKAAILRPLTFIAVSESSGPVAGGGLVGPDGLPLLG